MTVSAKLFSILTIGFREEDFMLLIKVHKGNWPCSLAAMFFD